MSRLPMFTYTASYEERYISFLRGDAVYHFINTPGDNNLVMLSEAGNHYVIDEWPDFIPYDSFDDLYYELQGFRPEVIPGIEDHVYMTLGNEYMTLAMNPERAVGYEYIMPCMDDQVGAFDIVFKIERAFSEHNGTGVESIVEFQNLREMTPRMRLLKSHIETVTTLKIGNYIASNTE